MNTLAENLTSLKSHVSTLETELADLQKGRKALAARARKLLQTLKVTSHTMRKQVVEHVKSLPTKTKTKIVVVAVPEPVVEPVVEAVPEVIQPKKRTKRKD